MHQSVRRDIARSIKCTSGRIGLLIRPTFQRGFQFRDRRIARAARRIDEDARFGLTSLATHLKPTVTTIEIQALEVVMAAIARILSRVSGTDIEVETLKTVAIFCGAGLLVALLSASYGLDLSPGFF